MLTSESSEILELEKFKNRCKLLEKTLKQLEQDYVFNLRVIQQRDEELASWEEKDRHWYELIQAKENQIRSLESKVLSLPHAPKEPSKRVENDSVNEEAHFLKIQLQRFLKYFKDIQSRLIQLEKNDSFDLHKKLSMKRKGSNHVTSSTPVLLNSPILLLHHASTQTSGTDCDSPRSTVEDSTLLLDQLRETNETLLQENTLLSNTIREMRVAMESSVQEYQANLKSKEHELELLRHSKDPSPAYQQLHQCWVETHAHLLQVMQDREVLIDQSNRLRAQFNRKPNLITIGVQTELEHETCMKNFKIKRHKETRKLEPVTKLLSLTPKEGFDLRKKGLRNWNLIDDLV